MADSLKNAKAKAYRLAREERQKSKIDESKFFSSMNKQEELQFEINNLKSAICNCNYDLANPLFIGNKSILRKKQLAEEQLKLKINQLEKIKIEKNE